MIKIWTNNKFEGHWPVGTAAVVIAETANDAATYLNDFLAEQGLPDTKGSDFVEMDFKDGQVSILCNGEY